MDPKPDYLIVSDPETDATIGVETSDDETALRVAWAEWYGDQPQNPALVARFTLKPAYRKVHPQLPARLH